MEINGVAHIFLSVRDFPASRAFYSRLLPFLGMTIVADHDTLFYGVGGRTGLGIQPCAPEHRDTAFNQWRPGLHHVCFRARAREDVDALHALVAELGAKVIRAPKEDAYAPGYYSILFEDPDGIRIELNHVPGRGLLAPGERLGGGLVDPSAG